MSNTSKRRQPKPILEEIPRGDGTKMRIKRSPLTGRILKLEHPGWGWLSVKDHYLWSKIHDLMNNEAGFPTKMIQGGYLFKNAVVNFNPGVFGVTIPAGAGLYGWAALNAANGLAAAAEAEKAGRGTEAVMARVEALKWLAAMALPFGDIWLIFMAAKYFRDRNPLSWFSVPIAGPEPGPAIWDDPIGWLNYWARRTNIPWQNPPVTPRPSP